MDYKKVENLSNGEWVLTEVKKEYGNYPGFYRNLPPGSACPTFRVDVPPFSLAETEEELLEKLREAEARLPENPLPGVGDAVVSGVFWENLRYLPVISGETREEFFEKEGVPYRKFLDLAVSVRGFLPGGEKSVLIRKEHLALIGKTEEELFEEAYKNLEETPPSRSDVITIRTIRSQYGDDAFGARIILRQNFPEEVEGLGSRFFVIGSKGELVLFPHIVSEEDVAELRRFHKAISSNPEIVAPEDFVNSTVYEVVDGEIKIAG